MKKIEEYIKKFWDYKLIILGIGCLFTSFVVYSSFWVDILNRYWVRPLMNKLYHNNDSACLVFIIFTIFFVIFYIISFKNTRHYSNLRILTNIISSAILLLCYFSGIWVYSQYAYSIILILSAEFILCLKLRWFYKAPNFTPLLEREDTQNISDSYSRKDVIKSTANTLKESFYENGSFVVGIKGIWGSGKTTFITLLKDEFKKINNKYLILNFEPWKSENPSSIIKSFFKLLEENLKYYIPAIRSDINHYLNYLHPLNEDSILGVINNIRYNIFEHQNPYSNINELFKNTKLPIIIFIDDIDRLNADEIIEVLKLVRNTANFPYVQFILCYDADYVINTLNNKGIENASKYLEKFFNVEIDLPNYEDRVITMELWNRLKHSFETIWSKDKTEIEGTLFVGERTINTYNGELKSDYKFMSEPLYFPVKYKIYSVIRTLLPTVRDVIRFSNSFILISSFYEKINKQNFISGYHLLMIELLRYRYPEIYNIFKLETSEFLELASNRYNLVDDYEKKLKESRTYTTEELNSLKFIHSIFNDDTTLYGISRVRSFPNYFMYREDEKYLKEYEIFELTSLNDEELSNRIEELYPQKYKNEFYDQFYNLLFKTIISVENEENDIKNMISIDIYYLMERLIKLNRIDLSNDILNAFYQISLCISRTTINNVKSIVNLIISIPDMFTNESVYKLIMHNLIYIDYIKKFVYNYENEEVKAQSKEILFTLLNADTHRSIKANVINKVILGRNKFSFDEDNLTIGENILIEVLKQYFLECGYKVSGNGFALFNYCVTACEKIKDKCFSNTVRDDIKQIMRKEFEEHPNDALSLFVSYTNYNVLYVNETFINLFGGKLVDNDKIEEFILSHSNCEKYKCVSNFWRIYQYNDYNDVLLNNDLNIDDLIKNNLDELIQKLEYLLDIYKNFENYEITKEFRNKVYLFPLKIKLREKVLSMINLKLDKDKEAKGK